MRAIALLILFLACEGCMADVGAAQTLGNIQSSAENSNATLPAASNQSDVLEAITENTLIQRKDVSFVPGASLHLAPTVKNHDFEEPPQKKLAVEIPQSSEQLVTVNDAQSESRDIAEKATTKVQSNAKAQSTTVSKSENGGQRFQINMVTSALITLGLLLIFHGHKAEGFSNYLIVSIAISAFLLTILSFIQVDIVTGEGFQFGFMVFFALLGVLFLYFEKSTQSDSIFFHIIVFIGCAVIIGQMFNTSVTFDAGIVPIVAIVIGILILLFVFIWRKWSPNIIRTIFGALLVGMAGSLHSTLAEDEDEGKTKSIISMVIGVIVILLVILGMFWTPQDHNKVAQTSQGGREDGEI